MQAAKRLSPVVFSLPVAYHGYARNSVRKRGDEMRQTGPICDSSTRTQSRSNNIISSCSQGAGRRKSVTDLAHISEQKFDGLKTQISSHSYFPLQHSPISCYSFVPRVVFHFQRSLHFVSWKAEVLERIRESWGSNSPVQQPGTESDYSCSDILPTGRVWDALLLGYVALAR